MPLNAARLMPYAGIAAAAVVGVAALQARAAPFEAPRKAPAPAVDVKAGGPGLQTAIVAGGCFWGLQGVYAHLKGVKHVEAGYSGGAANTAHYEEVGSGTTGHAESVKIDYDPAEVSYGQILRVFFSVATDPTQLNHQYPDTGPQYRSNIFATSPEQAQVAKAYIAQLNAAHVYPKPIVTRVDRATGFYPAEAYHQDYLVRHPDDEYIATFDVPKVDALRTLFPAAYAPRPLTTVAYHASR